MPLDASPVHLVLRTALVTLVMLAACAPAAVAPPVPAAPAPPVPAAMDRRPAPPPEGSPLASSPGVHATIRAPERASYDPTTLHAEPGPVVVRLTNSGSQPAPVGSLRISYSAVRNGVSFPCPEGQDLTAHVHEPSSLAPGQSFDFERDIDCPLPLPGPYEIGVLAQLREEREDAQPIGSFSLVVDEGRISPRPFASKPGLFAMMTGGSATQPWSPKEWARGAYHVIVAVIDGGHEPVHLGPARLTFAVTKKGSALACSGRAEPVALPESIAPGTMITVTVPLACAPSEPGSYEVVGRLALESTGEEQEAGRLGLEVTGNPLVFTPVPPEHERAPILPRNR
jgi:hypothetical protein